MPLATWYSGETEIVLAPSPRRTLMPTLVHLHWQSWKCPIALTVTLALVALAYLLGWFRLRHIASNVVSAQRAGGFLVGLLMIWAAMGSPLASCDSGMLTGHMIQHLLLMTIAPPLIFLGAPVRTLALGLPRFIQGALGTVSRRRPVQRLGAMMVEPVSCWIAATATLIAWHMP